MRLSRSGPTTAEVLFEIHDAAIVGSGVFNPLQRGSMHGLNVVNMFAAVGASGAERMSANGLPVRIVTTAVATGGYGDAVHGFPLRKRWNIAPLIPSAARRYLRYTFGATVWRNQLTALAAVEVGLQAKNTGIPGEAFTDVKYVFRSVLAEAAGRWQTSYRLVDGGAVVRADTGLEPLTPIHFKWVFDDGPVPVLTMFANDVLKLTARDGTAIALPTAIVLGTALDGCIVPGFGAEGAIGDIAFMHGAYYKIEAL